MATNDFLVWGGAPGANVLTQSGYASLPNESTGAVAGIASAQQANKTWRQASIIASMVAQAIADVTNQNSIDDGTIITLERNFVRMVRTGGGLYVVDAGTANSLNVTLSPAPSSLTTMLGMPIRVMVAATNTASAGIVVNGFTNTIIVQNGSPLNGGELTAGKIATLVYNGTYFELESKSSGT